MKTKSLMTMLLGGAMLAACTADDALTPAPVAQEVNPSAPVFNVTFEDDDLQLRGELNSSNGMVWKEGDLMSLFHGVQSDKLSDFIGWQNAVYEAVGSDEGKLTFLTNAMVQPGYAIMVYPADLLFDQMDKGLGKQKPVISLPDVQDVETKGNTPYISEILTLAAEPANGEAEAGYRKEYDIVMRRAASTLIVNLTATKDAPTIKDVAPFEIKSVELTGTFTKSIEIEADQSPRDDEAKPYWAYNSVMTVKDEADHIVTTDIKDNKVVTFTLLNKKQDLANSTVILHTNWGNITIDKDAENWVGKTKVTTTTALNSMFNVLFAEDTTDGGLFEGEIKGRATTVGLEVDMSDLKMNGMHIADQAALKTALAVYEGLPSTEEVTFILDGNEDNEFVINDEDLRAKVVGYMNAKNSTVKFQACIKDETEKCVAVKLVHAGETAEEVPNLVFDTTASDELQGSSNTINGIDVKLVGNWKYNSSKKDDEKKVLSGVSELVVMDGGVLELQSVDVNAATGSCEDILVERGGVVNVKAKTIIDMNLSNKGVINIDSNCSLGAADARTITNWWSEKLEGDENEPTGWNQTADPEKNRCGVINVKGTLAASEPESGTTTAKINNYGVIVLDGTKASAKVSTNGTSNASTHEAFKAPDSYTSGAATGGNVFGVIILDSGNNLGGGVVNALTGVTTGGATGFIKIELASNKDANNDNVGPIANYVVVNGTQVAATKDKELGKDNAFDYLELAGDAAVFGGSDAKNQKEFELKGLIVPNATVELSKEIKVTVTESIYLKGNINYSGTFDRTSATFEGYFAGDEDDYRNILLQPGA